MASPQTDNGYTKIANELLSALCRIRISGEARQVLDVIFRKTYGFNKKRDRIALSQFCLFTGLGKSAVCRAINKLIEMKLIIKIDNEKGEIYLIQKDFDQWKPLSKKITLSKKIIGVIKKDNASLSKKRHTKDNTTKETITKEIPEQSSGDIVKIINMFKDVNPSYKRWFANTTQRSACSRLLGQHGMEKLINVIPFLPSSNKTPFIPIATTPLQLEEKWSAIENAWIRRKNELQAKKRKIIL